MALQALKVSAILMEEKGGLRAHLCFGAKKKKEKKKKKNTNKIRQTSGTHIS